MDWRKEPRSRSRTAALLLVASENVSVMYFGDHLSYKGRKKGGVKWLAE
jgi:hypothetical protein